MASLFCDVEVPEFVALDCGTELGGFPWFGIIDADEDPTVEQLREASFWTAKLAASPTKYRIISDARGSYPGGTPVEEEGYGTVPILRTGADHEITWEVRGILQNRSFFAGINQTAKWHVVAVTRGLVGLYIRDTSIYSTITVDQSIKSTTRWKVSTKWSDDLSNPVVFQAPSTIFV